MVKVIPTTASATTSAGVTGSWHVVGSGYWEISINVRERLFVPFVVITLVVVRISRWVKKRGLVSVVNGISSC